MNIEEILRQLENAGLNVVPPRADGINIYIEDPSCVLRGFETFIEYAWLIITIITGILLFGWAISLLRGARTDYITNIRNLLIMFGGLAAAGPIVNLIWGGDLIGRGCRTVAIPIAGVEEILQARKKKFGPNDSLYEIFDIHDSGVDVGEILNPEYAPPMGTPDTEPAPSPDENDNDGRGGGPIGASNSLHVVSASEDGRDVIYKHLDNSRVRYTGGTRAWRNTNPGNLRNYKFSKDMGSVGHAGGFAVFPDENTGMAALIALLRSDTYRNRTIADAVRRYAPPSENDTTRYMQRLAQLTGVDLNRRMGDLTDTEIRRVANAIRQIEGWRTGRKIRI